MIIRQVQECDRIQLIKLMEEAYDYKQNYSFTQRILANKI